MSALFDTHKAVKSLREHGFTEEQAEAITEVLRGVQGGSELVTKKDLHIELAPIKADIRLMAWMLGLIVVAEVMPWVIKLFA